MTSMAICGKDQSLHTCFIVTAQALDVLLLHQDMLVLHWHCDRIGVLHLRKCSQAVGVAVFSSQSIPDYG